MSRYLVGLLAAGMILTPAGPALGQQPVRREILVTPSGERLDFNRNGAWRVKARRVAEWRRQMLEQGQLAAMNAAAQGGQSSAAVSGTLRVPAILFRYADVGTATTNDTSAYRELLFSASPPSGRPYSYQSFYAEQSNGQLTIQGQVIGWIQLDSAENAYTGTPGTCSGNPFGTSNCNGLFSTDAVNRRRAGLREALAKVDTGATGVDFGQFDNDGPDGIPNSGDDDGMVDFVLFLQSEPDGACGGASNNHMWSHRSSSVGGYTTNDPRSGGGVITVGSYIIQSAGGGSTVCGSPTALMPIGTVSHETGHALGLPDLYDTQTSSEGIGEWGLMGSGNYTSGNSPTMFSAWSRQQLGWITVVGLTTSGTRTFGPSGTSDTTFLVRTQGSNPRGEQYLLENRYPALTDTARARTACNSSGQSYPSPCNGGGLVIWHVDSTKIAQGDFTNTVNASTPKGVRVVEADGADDLLDGTNRGDAGDPYPGTSNNTAFNLNSTPAAVKNSDGSFAGISIDSIRFTGGATGEMAFRLRFGAPTVVRASDTLATITVDGAPYNRFYDLLEDGQSYTIGIDSLQFTTDSLRQYLFLSWSDGGARTHTITGAFAGDSISAGVERRFRLRVTVSGTGTVASDSLADLTAGGYLKDGSSVEVTATPGTGQVFDGWSGDTTATAATITLAMVRARVLTATFIAQLAAVAGAPPTAVMGASYSHTLTVTGGTGNVTWSLRSGALPKGLTLSAVGVISGRPAETGTFNATARATSGSQTSDVEISLTVTAPQLATQTVVNHLLGMPGLTTDEQTYLDLLGNDNGSFDLGDFLAWVQATGAPVTDEMMRQVLTRTPQAGRRD